MVTNYQQSFSEVSHFRGRHFRGFTVLVAVVKGAVTAQLHILYFEAQHQRYQKLKKTF